MGMKGHQILSDLRPPVNPGINHQSEFYKIQALKKIEIEMHMETEDKILLY